MTDFDLEHHWLQNWGIKLAYDFPAVLAWYVYVSKMKNYFTLLYPLLQHTSFSSQGIYEWS